MAGALFNAIAFAGAGYVFHKLDKNGYEKDMEQHDKAMKKLSKEKEKWYESTVEKKNKIALLRQEAIGREQGPGRRKRRVAQPSNGHGRPAGPRGAGAENFRTSTNPPTR